MADREKVIKGLEQIVNDPFMKARADYWALVCSEAIVLLKEQEKKEIKLYKKHVITWKRDDEFTTRKLYEAVCETLMDEGELVIVRMDDHEKVDFTFYVTQ